MLTLACLTYMSYDNFSEGLASDKDELEQRLECYPLAKFSCSYMGDTYYSCFKV